MLHLNPLKVELFSPEGELQVSLNERALLHYEASAAPVAVAQGQAGKEGEGEDRHGGKKVVDYGEDGEFLLLCVYVRICRYVMVFIAVLTVGLRDVFTGCCE